MLFASDYTPLPFAGRGKHEIDYSTFSLRVAEKANVSAVVTALRKLPVARLHAMASAMAAAAKRLDYSAHGGLVDAALRRHVRVASSVSLRNHYNSCATPVPKRKPELLCEL